MKLRSIAGICGLFVAAGLLSGCVFASVVPPRGVIYTDQTAPLFPGGGPGTAEGRASAHNILFLVGWGNVGLDKAMKNGGIKQVSHTDYRIENYALIYQRFTIIVKGETEPREGPPGGGRP